MMDTQIALSLTHSLFWIGVCIHMYIPVCICICLHWEVGGSIFPVFALPVLKHCPAVPPISALILMLLGRQTKTGIASPCRDMVNLEMVGALPKGHVVTGQGIMASN